MDANKDWFPFFSMLFWCVSKVAGLSLFLFGLSALCSVLLGVGGFDGGGWFWRLVLTAAMPMVIGLFFLKTDLLHDWATEAQRSKRPTGS